MRFSLWAPRPGRVDVEVDGRRVPMAPEEGGWWAAEVPARPGARYGFSLDGGPLRADPRSPSQPDGVEGLSAGYDHGAFFWTDARWPGRALEGAVLYELHIGTFSAEGTFDGAIAHLDHLVELGVDAVELLPVATFSGDRGWGYDGVHLFAPHPAYGGPDGLKRLVDACHAHGIGVLMDVVYNHLGPVGNHLGELGPYFTDRHRTAWGDAVNVDGPGSAEVRRFILDNATSWVRDYHCDGLRLDAVHAIVDDSPRHLLAELAEEVAAAGRAAGRTVVVIAESEANDPILVRSPPEGYGLDAVWADDWHHALHAVLTGEAEGYYEDFGEPDDLVTALQQAWVYDGRWSVHHGRPRGGSPAGLPPTAFVIATQNHDQVGNRAAGERLGALTTPGRLRIAAALLLTSPFTPMLFQGEEWAAGAPFQYMTDHRDPALATAVREGRRAEFAAFGWAPDAVPDPQDPATFERSRLDWREPAQPEHAEHLAWHRALIALRRQEPDLRDPAVGVHAHWDDGVLVVRRGSIAVVANLDVRPRHAAASGAVRLATEGVREGRTVLELAPDSVAILRSTSPRSTDG